MEVLYNLNYGSGTSVYTGAQRYSLSDFNIQQHKIELKGDNFFLRGYATLENSGDSYIADLSGVLINDSWKTNSDWFRDYSLGYLTYLGTAPGAMANPTDPLTQQAAHRAARVAADQGRLLPGTPAFEAAKKNAQKDVIPRGSRFDDQSALYHAEGQYD